MAFYTLGRKATAPTWAAPGALQGTSLHREKWNAELRCCRGLMLPKTHLHAPCIYLITRTVGLLRCVWMLYLMNAGTYQSSPERVGIHIGICQMAGWIVQS